MATGGRVIMEGEEAQSGMVSQKRVASPAESQPAKRRKPSDETTDMVFDEMTGLSSDEEEGWPIPTRLERL